MSSAAPATPRQPSPAEHVLQVGAGYIASIALNIVVELGIADHISDAPRPVSELARETSTNEDALYRILRLLASLGIFTEAAPRAFAHTAASETLRSGASHSPRDLVHYLCNPFHFRMYAELMHSVRTGQTCVERVTGGKPIFEYFPTDPHESETFNRAMVSFSAQVVPAVLEAYDFSGIGTLVDVAGGHGSVLLAILAKYPQMRGILTDLDHVIAGAAQAVRRAGLEDRCTLQTCDFFHSVPAGGDAYLMKHIIHDWDDFKSLTILRNIATALNARSEAERHARPGRVILLEAALSPGNEPHFGKFIDIEMLASPGGKERTEAEFADLLHRAGFELTRVVHTKSPLAVIEAMKVQAT